MLDELFIFLLLFASIAFINLLMLALLVASTAMRLGRETRAKLRLMSGRQEPISRAKGLLIRGELLGILYPFSRRQQEARPARQSVDQLAKRLYLYNRKIAGIVGELPLYADNSTVQCRLFEQAVESIYQQIQSEWKAYFGSETDQKPDVDSVAHQISRYESERPTSVSVPLVPNARADYNVAAESMSDERRVHWLEHPGRKRVTAPSRELAASPLYNPQVTVELVEADDGMFVMVNENGRDLLFPNFRIRADQRMLLSYCFLVKSQGANGLASARVLNVEKPARSERRGNGWVLQEKGAVVLGPSRQ